MSSRPRCASALALLREGWYVVAGALLMTTAPFITTMSKNERGGYDYLAISITLVVEVVKLLISFCFYAFTLPASKRTHRSLRRNDVLLFALPAAVYAANNNLMFAILAYVSTSTYQVLSSLKTLFTAVLFRVVLKRVLSDVQVAAVILLACAAEVAAGLRMQTGGQVQQACNGTSDESDAAGSELWMGALLALLACLFSALGGIYSELALKKDGQLHSIHLQNMMLYVWGVCFNALALLWRDQEALREGGLLQGYTPLVLLLIVNNALVGLAISAILKFANNLVRIFAHTAAMLLTMFLEGLLLGRPLSPQVATAVAIVGCASYLFGMHGPPPLAPEQAAKRSASLPTADDDDDSQYKRSAPPLPASVEHEDEGAPPPSSPRGGRAV